MTQYKMISTIVDNVSEASMEEATGVGHNSKCLHDCGHISKCLWSCGDNSEVNMEEEAGVGHVPKVF